MRNWLTQLGRLRSLLISCRQAADPGKSVVPLSSSLNMRTRDANDINRSPDWKSWDSWDVSAESARHAKRGQFILPLPFVLFRHWTHKIRPTYIVILFLLFIYLAVTHLRSLLQHVGSSSQVKGRTHDLCVRSAEPYPLDH